MTRSIDSHFKCQDYLKVICRFNFHPQNVINDYSIIVISGEFCSTPTNGPIGVLSRRNKMKKGMVLEVISIIIVLGFIGCGAGNSNNNVQTLSSSKAITSFSILSPAAEGTINENLKTISITVPYGTPVTALIATFTTTGASVKVGLTVQVSGSTANDFTKPVSYDVIAENGSHVSYIVTVTVSEPQNSAKAITAFSIADPPATGIISEASKSITVVVPYGTIRAALTATFATTGVTVKVGGTLQQSGSTINDFSNPVIYTVTAEDGSTTAYTVRVMIQNYVGLQSDAGDYIGQGKNYFYTQADAQLVTAATGNLLSINIHGDQMWTGDFQTPNTVSQLQPGTYSNLTRYPFSDPVVGGLSWYGEGRGCNTLTGWFVIDNATYINGNLTEIDLHFEQHCEGATVALHGQIHWTSYDTTTPPGPVNPPPNGLWEPVSGTTPTTSNYVYLQSDSGDFIGAGQTYTYMPSDSQITLSTNGGLFTLNISGSKYWTGDFQAMSTLTQLEPGYYGNLQRYPFNNPTRGGLSWYGDGRGCNTLTGWFVVDNVTYSGATITAIDLRFEQHCEGATAALHGQIHWIQ